MYRSLQNLGRSFVPAILAIFCIASTCQARLGADVLTSITVSGTAGPAINDLDSTFTGAITVTKLELGSGSTLTATGFISGTVTADTGTTSFLTQTFVTSATLVEGPAVGNSKKCTSVVLDLAPTNLDVVDLSVDVAPVTIDVASVKGTARNLANSLCKLADLLPTQDAAKIQKVLVKINSVTGGWFQNIAISGSVTSGTDTGTLDGYITLQSLSISGSNDLLYHVLLNGVVVLDNDTTSIINEEVATTGTISITGKGTALTLNLDLNEFVSTSTDADLVVDIQPVAIDLSGYSGNARKLINSLRSLTKNLNGIAVNDVAKSSKIINAINALLL